MASAGKVEISLVAETSRFRADFQSFAREMGGHVSSLQQSFEGLAGKIRFAMDALGGFGLAHEALAMANWVHDAAAFGAQISTMAQQIGVGTKALQEMKFAASESGVGFDKVQTGLEAFARTVGEAQEGNKDAIDAFKSLGMGIDDASGHLRPFEDLIHEAAARIDAIKDPVEKATEAHKVFGREAQNMLPVMHQLGAGWTDLQAKAEEYGQVLPDSVIEADKKITDDWDGMVTTWNNIWATIAGTFSGIVAGFRDYLFTPLMNLEKGFLDLIQQYPALLGMLVTGGHILGPPSGMPLMTPSAPSPAANNLQNTFLQADVASRALVGGEINPPYAKTGGGGGARVRDAAAEAAKREEDAVKRVVEQLKFEADTAGMDVDNLRLMNALRQAGTDLTTAYGQQILKAWQAEVKAAESARKAAEGQRQLNQERTQATQIVERFKTPMAKLIDDYRTLNQALKDGVISQQDWIDGTKGVLQAQKDLDDGTKQLNQDIAETAKTIGTDLGDALAAGVTGAKTWKEAMTDAIKSIVQELAKLALKLAEKPLEDFIGNLNLFGPSIANAGGLEPFVTASGAPGGYVHAVSGITGHQAGGHIGGASIVGEYGPELFVPDTPGMVLSNDTLTHGLRRGGGTHYHVDARGAELGVETRVMAALRELHRSIEPRAVAAVDASRRRGGAIAQTFRR